MQSNSIILVFQIRVGGVQRAVLAGVGPADPGPQVLPSRPRPVPAPSLPHHGGRRLTTPQISCHSTPENNILEKCLKINRKKHPPG